MDGRPFEVCNIYKTPQSSLIPRRTYVSHSTCSNTILIINKLKICQQIVDISIEIGFVVFIN